MGPGFEEELRRCRWPDLPPRYGRALRAAVRFVLERFQAVGIIATGTIIRGAPDAASDLDIYVIHRKPTRQRLQRFFDRVPAEIFVNPGDFVSTIFRTERAGGRATTAHMLATGVVILDRDPIVGRLREEAERILASGPDIAPERLNSSRYMAALLYEDAADVAERDPETASMLLGRAVDAMLAHFFRREGRFLPRAKEWLRVLSESDQDLGQLARNFFLESEPGSRLELAGRIADRTIGTRGFFEWESPVEDVSEPIV